MGDPGEGSKTKLPEPDDCPVSKLYLDTENPRLREAAATASQEELAQLLAGYNLEELGESMAELGYFRQEPLLVVPDDKDPDAYVVVEGNRRLAALKLLADASAHPTDGGNWAELAQRAQENGHDLSQVPILKYERRENLLEYLGFRHVSGLIQWESEAKARFVHRLIVHHRFTFEKAARVIGSRSDAIRRQFVAWSTLEQARKAGIDVSYAVDRFGVFYRALQNPAIRAFAGVQGWTDAEPAEFSPLESDSLPAFTELLGFIFGPDRVIRESRRLDELGRVLAEPLTVEILRQSRDLDSAIRELPEDRTALIAALRVVFRRLTVVNGQIFEFEGDADLLTEAERIQKVATVMIESLRG
ncbi:ParB N-terminal domain-containing protein [Actinomycetospora chibensis]|uniref:ParB N-terminal domain-containing protein n=1 Tax=Actinomycetospora chibensis TaxID=663606 RepID=A0ABV9RLV7_9PSEU|nr:ParB N-terminal domain-containing protein [Actinomycetospora chibensis]MDD7924305.1 ParB N-terminal domain-containing protein [Actinomycetospora chibensis]